jgi:hypothetical protein
MVVLLTVDLDQSDLPFQTAFPILMSNALAEFSGSKGELREAVSTGGVAEVELPGSHEWTLIAPDGREKPLPKGIAKITVGPFDRCGVWSVSRREAAVRGQPAPPLVTEAEIACNLSSRRETDLRPPSEWKPNRPTVASGFGGRPVWYYLIAVAWLLAGLEWFLYQRRWIS